PSPTASAANTAPRPPHPCSAAAPCVLRDAPLQGAPQDEGRWCVASKAHLILRSRRSRRLEGRTSCRPRLSAIVMQAVRRHHPARPSATSPPQERGLGQAAETVGSGFPLARE